MRLFWWHEYGQFSPSSEIRGYPDAHEVFSVYYQRSGISRGNLAVQLGIQEKMVYHIEKYGTSLHSIARLRQLCTLLHIPACLFGLADQLAPFAWKASGYDWPAGDDGFPAPGAVVRHFRQHMDWRQKDLADALGVSEVTVRLMEKNENLDALNRRQALAFALGLPATARIWLGLDPFHGFLPSAPPFHVSATPPPSLEHIHAIQSQLWTGYYAGANREAGIAQAKELFDRIGDVLPQVGEAERPLWLATQSLLLQWVVNASRDTSEPRIVLGRSKKALELAKQAGVPDLISTARMRQMETTYLVGRDDLAIAYAHVLAETPAPDRVVNSTRAAACARVLAYAAGDQEDRSLVLGLLEQATKFGGADYGLNYDEPTYLLRYAESLINLAQNAPDHKILLRQAEQVLTKIKEPVGKLRMVGLRTAQAQVAARTGELEQAAKWANEAIQIGMDIASTTHLSGLVTVYHTLRQSAYKDAPLTAKLGLSLIQLNQL